MENITRETCVNKRWEKTGQICKESAMEVLGKVQPNNRQHDNDEIRVLSLKQKKLALQIESNPNKYRRSTLQK